MSKLLALFFSGWIALLSLFGFRADASSENVALSNPGSVSFIVFGDSGTGDKDQQTLARVMESYPVDAIIHTGDLAYPEASEDNLMKNFYAMYEPILSRTPFYPAPGNHDYAADNLNPYRVRFGKEPYYSFDAGPIHFISLDTNTDMVKSGMIKWLKTDLRKAAKNKWIVAYFHHPPFSSGSVHGSSKEVRQLLVPIFSAYHVQVVFSGHEHNYERMKPMNGTTYVVTGGGSGNLYGFGPALVTSAFRASQTHFVYVTATDCTFDAKAINSKNDVIDTFSLKRCGN